MINLYDKHFMKRKIQFKCSTTKNLLEYVGGDQGRAKDFALEVISGDGCGGFVNTKFLSFVKFGNGTGNVFLSFVTFASKLMSNSFCSSIICLLSK